MNKDQKFGIVLLIFCFILWFFLIPTQISSTKDAVYPRLVNVWIAICGILLILKSWKSTEKIILDEAKDKQGIIRVIAIVIIFLIYIFIIDFLGFFISSFIFIIILMLSFGVRQWIKLISVPIIILLFLYFLIEKVLVFPLPKGIFF